MQESGLIFTTYNLQLTTLLLFTLTTFIIYIYNCAYLEVFLQDNFSYILL